MKKEQFANNVDKDSLLKLDNQLCFAIYACAKQITSLYRPFLEEIGLTYTQYITLLVLWERDDLTLKELGEKLFLDSGTLTPVLKKMEAAGYLRRQRSREDERNLCIKLTDKGRKLKEVACEIPVKVACSSDISVEEGVDLREKLKALLNRLAR
ncbi:MarR family transcriptional regulator [Sporomusa sphaeroides DSM 2875]|uniref:MarR family winged helix-turn-helix transcriptional regulator n=1 Tax=Sporomusa sphaeroides TaxID=47679 RepID=UPI00202EA769|nr:MarR family transcriptional regulator [Sporomusa sphaeroides]MCM0757762.1 MarR family transcriptional regulator [Sporomusa sphaeroides DSM 2875]